MEVAFAHRPPVAREVERLRLLLSTYQDGSGMLSLRGVTTTLPGWRDFERAVALTWNGRAQENKAVFDVLLPDATRGIAYGISCKMRDALREAKRTGHVTIELSNSSGYFWTALGRAGISQDNYGARAAETGRVLLDLVQNWHQAVSMERGGAVDVARSCYLVLQWDRRTREYRLFQYPLGLPAAESLRWEMAGRRLAAYDSRAAKLLEWYGESGGQLKYYPYWDDALWVSPAFELEPLPAGGEQYGLLRKAAAYFPAQWAEAGAGQ